MKRLKEKIFILLFILFIFGFTTFNLKNKSDEYLFFENRNIESYMELNKENLLSGEYFLNIDKYLSDTFVYRDELLRAGININLNILKRPEINNLYITDSNILAVPKYWKSSYPASEIEDMGRLYNNINLEMKKRDIEYIYVGIPHHTSIFTEEYAEHFYNRNEEWLNIEDDFFGYLDKYNVKNIKMRSIMESKKKEYYNATDHHFSYIGAIRTYQEILDKINSIGNYELSSDNLEIIKEEKIFKGSYSRKLFNLDKFEDEAIRYKEDFQYTRRDSKGNFGNRLFILEENTMNNMLGYGMYMGGDLPFTEIDSNRPELPNVLIYGDSFTNPIETLMARNCDKMWSVDFRHYTEKNLIELVDELNPDFVICIRDNFSYILKEGNGQFDLKFDHKKFEHEILEERVRKLTSRGD